MVRALQRSILGRNCGDSFCSIRIQRTPRRPRSMASVKPTGPAPTIMTWVSGTLAKLRSYFDRRAAQEFVRAHRLAAFALHLCQPHRAIAAGDGEAVVKRGAGFALAVALGRSECLDARAAQLEPGAGKRRQPADVVVNLFPRLCPIDAGFVLGNFRRIPDALWRLRRRFCAALDLA